MIAFGGAAPLHAARVAEKLGIARVLVPVGAGVGSAIGFLRAPVSFELSLSWPQPLATLDMAELNARLGAMAERALAAVRAASDGPVEEERSALMRYRGQGHEIEVQLPEGELGAADRTMLAEAFDAAYRKLYSRTIPHLAIEAMTWMLRVRTVPVRPQPLPAPPAASASAPVVAERHFLDPLSEREVPIRVVERHALRPGLGAPGPAALIEDETTTLVPVGWSAPADMSGLAAFRQQLVWDRLVTAVEEQAQTLIRTAFSPSTREAGDLSAGVFDRRGRMLAQAVTGTPGHINAMALAVAHFLRAHPVDTLKPGDVLMTNDPWMGSGHLHDFTVVTPAFHRGRLVALFAATVHVVDIGGLGVGVESRDVFQEGFYIPITFVMRQGEPDETLFRLLRANVREPDQVEGDLHSLVASNQAGVDRLVAMLADFGLDDLEAVGDRIVEDSRDAMLRAIAEAPRGTWHSELTMDGVDQPVALRIALTIADDGITVDFEGTAGQSPFGINVPKCYTDAYTGYAVRCVIGGEVPNNAGSLSVVRVVAPERSIVNALKPAPVTARHMVGQMLPDLVFGALAQAFPDKVPAEGTSALWNLRLSGGIGTPGVPASAFADPKPFTITSFNTGGAGARPGLDGLSATAFPSGVRNVPLEITEAMTPLVFWRKALRDGSGGAGRWRGGDGQVVEISHRRGEPFALNATFERVQHAARGRDGGADGAHGVVRLGSGKVINGKGRQTIPAGENLVVEMPGGGGFGPARQRDPALVARDLAEARVTEETARTIYGFNTRESET
jgi:N-methylhydantoinase B/oxoprolinase/acetone carboxylase alpha subunit